VSSMVRGSQKALPRAKGREAARFVSFGRGVLVYMGQYRKPTPPFSMIGSISITARSNVYKKNRIGKIWQALEKLKNMNQMRIIGLD
jgi:hypothetical protein